MSEQLLVSISDMKKSRIHLKNSRKEKEEWVNGNACVQVSEMAKRLSYLSSMMPFSDTTEDKQHLLNEMDTISHDLYKIVKNEIASVSNKNFISSFSKPLIKVKKLGEVIKFSFDDNLPHKMSIDKFSKRVRYAYDTQEYYSWCWKSTLEFFKENGPTYFYDKCAVYFVSYYDKNTNPLDNENIDVKYFIDGAIRPFVCGDDPFHLSVYFDGYESDFSHTEVFFGKKKDVLEIMKNME